MRVCARECVRESVVCESGVLTLFFSVGPVLVAQVFYSYLISHAQARNTQRDETLPRIFRVPIIILHSYRAHFMLLTSIAQKLAHEGFLSAPVVDGSRFVGFIDMMDLVLKVLKHSVVFIVTLESYLASL